MYRMFEGTQHARLYAQFRPQPPADLITRVVSFVRESVPLERAVDVGCGTGQNSRLLAAHCASVLATDISPAQVAEAEATGRDSNSGGGGAVTYQVAPAESIPAPDSSVQLVTASMCFHYLDRPRFLAEADRVLTPGGVIAIYGYKEPYARRPDGTAWSEFNAVVDEVREVDLKEHWSVTVSRLAEMNREMQDMIPYTDTVWDETTYYTERPLSVDIVLGEICSWSGFQNMATARGTAEAETLIQRTGQRLQAVVSDAEREGVDVTAATERRQCFLMLARKPADQ